MSLWSPTTSRTSTWRATAASTSCSPPPRDHARWGRDLGGHPHRRLPDLLVRPLPVPVRQPCGQAGAQGRTSFRWVPNGIRAWRPGYRSLPARRVEGRITLNQFVALTSTNHAKLYGLYPRKGSIAPGFDADIVLWDPQRRVTVTQDLMQHGADYTPYEGIEVTGWPEMTSCAAGGHAGRRDPGRQGRRPLPNGPGSRRLIKSSRSNASADFQIIRGCRYNRKARRS